MQYLNRYVSNQLERTTKIDETKCNCEEIENCNLLFRMTLIAPA